MANDNEAELIKAQQQLGPILRFIANQPVGVPPSLAGFSASSAGGSGHDHGSTPAHHMAQSAADGGVSAAQSAAVVAALKHMVPTQSMLPSAAAVASASPAGTPPVPAALSMANVYATQARPTFQQSLAAAAAAAAAAVATATSTAGSTTAVPAGAAAAPGSSTAVTHSSLHSSSHAAASMAPGVATSSSMSNADDNRYRKSSASAMAACGNVENDSADEDDDDTASLNASSTAVTPAPISSGRKSDHRRAAHTSAEQKRRDDIKHGYEDLASLIPSCQTNNNSGQKLSKAVILQRSIDYLTYLKKHRQQQEQDLVALRNEVVALRIMKRNYEQLAKAHTALPPEKTPQVSDAAKFEVFKAVMDTLFQSFDACISVNNFEVLSSSIFQWLEEFCKPQNMRGIVISSLQTLQKQPAGSMYGGRS
ncbi:max-like protein X [Sycon ciliatum]|uniref:max-like protein X n=1 Tax=Sycon ciliatum TaxID=27933 RepID=UPI0020A99B45